MESVALGTINETTTTSDAGNEITSSFRGGYTCCVPLCYNNSKRNRASLLCDTEKSSVAKGMAQ